MDTFHILNIKTARTGFTESAQMLNQALVARQGGDGRFPGQRPGWGTLQAALFAAKPGINLPCELSFFLKLKEDLLTRPPVIRDGYLDVSGLAQTTNRRRPPAGRPAEERTGERSTVPRPLRPEATASAARRPEAGTWGAINLPPDRASECPGICWTAPSASTGRALVSSC